MKYSDKLTEKSMGSLKEKDFMPKPKGYKILIAMPGVNEKTDGGIIIPEKERDREATASVVGFVVMLGEDAYKDDGKFPQGPWCKEGDWVVFRSYTGTRFKIDAQEFRLINDDSVEAVVADPRGVTRV